VRSNPNTLNLKQSMRAIQRPVAAYARADKIGVPRQITVSPFRLVRSSCLPSPAREVLDRHASGEPESQEALRKQAAAHQPSRGEIILLSLAILFTVSDVGLFTWYTTKLTTRIDQYVTHSKQAQFGIHQYHQADEKRPHDNTLHCFKSTTDQPKHETI
jgi:hypothetical protein